MANDLQVSKAEVGAWIEYKDAIFVPKVEVGAWLDAVNQITPSKVEVGAWLDYSNPAREFNFWNFVPS